MNKINYASPDNISKKQFFSHDSLQKLKSICNSFKDPKYTIKSNTSAKIYKELNINLAPLCGKNRYYLWHGVIEHIAEKKLNAMEFSKVKNILRKIMKKDLKPEKPESWSKNPKQWLSNYDIKNVMTQYTVVKKYNYSFLGVFPIDFALKDLQGNCLYSEFCNINVSEFIRKKKSFLGFITNLDKHNQPGSHWTSSFIVLNPSLSTYGAYYYDSVGLTIPKYLKNVFTNIQQQCNKLYPDKKFSICCNKKQHQQKNTECGMFSMLFQIRWLNKHIVKKNQTSMEEIIGNSDISDDNMLKLRDHFFRPNTKVELKAFLKQ